MRTKEELSKACRAVMMLHLEGLGFPAMSRRQILAQTKPMWDKFAEAGLAEDLAAYDCTFRKFEDLAVRIAQESAIMEQFDMVGNIFKPRRKR